MKPIKLKIKGINSYVTEQEVNFSKLAESNVFGIFGETGSGKTTILDSIILALYGVSDRDSLQNLINVNTKDAYIEFTFDMENAKNSTSRYFVRRDFKLRPSGLKAEAILNDVHKKITIAEMPENVNNAILDIIGIGKKEFTKCIALPQGEFDKFLADTPAVRKKTLAKLFDLEQFGIVLNDKLKQRKATVNLQKTAVEEKLAIYDGINQETIDKTEEVLRKSDDEIKSINRQVAKDKKLAETIKSELEAKEELLDLEVSLSIKQTELAEINLLEKQIDYTEKYGDFTILNNKYNNTIEELDKLAESRESQKTLLINISEDIKKLRILIEDNKQKTSDLEKQLSDLQVVAEKKALHEEKLQALTDEKNMLNQRIVDVSAKIVETNTILKKYKSTIVDLQASYEKLQNTIDDNNSIIEKLDNCQEIRTKQDFALFLTITKNKINPESLAEVENFNIYDEVHSVIHNIEEYEYSVRKEIGDIIRDLQKLDVNYENIEEIKEEFIHRNELLNKKCNELEDKLILAKQNLTSAKSQIDNNKAQVDEYNIKIEHLKKAIEKEKEVLSDFVSTNDITYITRTIERYIDEHTKMQIQLENLNTKKQQALIDIEVTTNNIENYKERLNALTNELKPYSKAIFKQKADSSLMLNYDDIPAIKEKIDAFHKELTVLETNTLKLREKTKEYLYTRDDYNNLVSNIQSNEEKLTELKVFVNVNKITIDIQKENLNTVKELTKEKDFITKQFETIEKLESLLSGGSLIEFVAEEYMGLITDFANKYVYQISRGKYLLNYDGDFNVIDNFNGGIKRSVRTLSGGERFIVSLSLALGISQSIAVNNNKDFNFFFIDEGFGNLSDNYIEKVLLSFDVLIKLNFTVGFITHVDKMQYYLNNKIIVTKPNNEEGSKIEQFF